MVLKSVHPHRRGQRNRGSTPFTNYLQLNDTTVQIYTDGSGIHGGIGAAMCCHTDQHVDQRYLGKNSESMVYARELEAIHMAVIHIKRQPGRRYAISAI